MSEESPKSLEFKINVNVPNMQTLIKNLEADLEAFDDEFNRWNHKNRDDHPSAAQIGANPLMVEGTYVKSNNDGSVLEAGTTYAMVKRSLLIMALGAKNIGLAYQSEDSLAHVKLSQIEAMFPEQPFKPGQTDAERAQLPPVEDWVLIPGQGWDTNKDGKMDVPLPAGAGPLDRSTSDSDQGSQPPDPVAATTHDGYQDPFKVNVPGAGEDSNSANDNALSQNGLENLKSMDDLILGPDGRMITRREYFFGTS